MADILPVVTSHSLAAVKDVHAVIIRSETTITAEVLAAGANLVVVARAGIGLDNVDVAAATRRGVMVVNAPSPTSCPPPSTPWLSCWRRPGTSPRPMPPSVRGEWQRARWQGVELHGEVPRRGRPRRVGALVAQRALAFGMTLAAYDPFVSARAGPADGGRLLGLEELVRGGPLPHHPPSQDAGRPPGSSAKELLSAGPARTLRIVNTARGGIVDESELAWAIEEGFIVSRAR